MQYERIFKKWKKMLLSDVMINLGLTFIAQLNIDPFFFFVFSLALIGAKEDAEMRCL